MNPLSVSTSHFSYGRFKREHHWPPEISEKYKRYIEQILSFSYSIDPETDKKILLVLNNLLKLESVPSTLLEELQEFSEFKSDTKHFYLSLIEITGLMPNQKFSFLKDPFSYLLKHLALENRNEMIKTANELLRSLNRDTSTTFSVLSLINNFPKSISTDEWLKILINGEKFIQNASCYDACERLFKNYASLGPNERARIFPLLPSIADIIQLDGTTSMTIWIFIKHIHPDNLQFVIPTLKTLLSGKRISHKEFYLFTTIEKLLNNKILPDRIGLITKNTKSLNSLLLTLDLLVNIPEKEVTKELIKSFDMLQKNKKERLESSKNIKIVSGELYKHFCEFLPFTETKSIPSLISAFCKTPDPLLNTFIRTHIRDLNTEHINSISNEALREKKQLALFQYLSRCKLFKLIDDTLPIFIEITKIVFIKQPSKVVYNLPEFLHSTYESRVRAVKILEESFSSKYISQRELVSYFQYILHLSDLPDKTIKNALLRIHQISLEYLVSPETLIRKNIQGEFERYLILLTYAHKCYSEILKSYEPPTHQKVFLLPPKNERPALTKRLLMKIIIKSLKALSNKQVEEGVFIDLKKYHWSSILAVKDRQRNLHLIHFDKKDNRPIGSGAFAFALKTYDIATKTIGVSKISRKKTTSQHELNHPCSFATRSANMIFNEAKLLRKLHGGTIRIGLYPPPMIVFSFSGKNKSAGFFSRYYNMRDLLLAHGRDLSKSVLLKLSVKTLLNIALQICKGACHLKKMHFLHGDIKPENIFLHKQEDGTYVAVLGDLGGSKDLREEDSIRLRIANSRIVRSITTPGFFTIGDNGDLSRQQEAYKQSLSLSSISKELEKFVEYWEHLNHQRDLFATARSLVALFTGNEIVGGCGITSKEDAILPKLSNALKRFPKIIVSTLTQALNCDPLERPTIEELTKVIEHTSAKLSS